jgi:phage terminase large subunit
MPTIRLPHNWNPRPYQLPSWRAWEKGCKREILIWHRRAGKDDVQLNKTAVAAHERIGNYWHCLPMYEQAKKAIWEAVNPNTGKRRIDEAFPLEIRKRTDNSSMVIEFKSGSIWRVVGSDNPNSLVGAPPIAITFSEWALSNPSAWAYAPSRCLPLPRHGVARVEGRSSTQAQRPHHPRNDAR